MSLGLIFRWFKGSPLTSQEADGNMQKLEAAADNERIVKRFHYIAQDGVPFTVDDVLTPINQLPAYTVKETQSVYFVGLEKKLTPNGTFMFTGASRLYERLYMGKGNYGAGSNNNVISYNLLQLLEKKVSVEDIEQLPGANIITLGNVPGGDFIALANQEVWDFTLTQNDEGEAITYYFSYTTNNVLYFAQFIGQNGIYGAGTGNLFIPEQFNATTNSTMPPVAIPGLQEVLDQNPTAVIDTDFSIEHKPFTTDFSGVFLSDGRVVFDAGDNQTTFTNENTEFTRPVKMPLGVPVLFGSLDGAGNGGIMSTGSGRLLVFLNAGGVGMSELTWAAQRMILLGELEVQGPLKAKSFAGRSDDNETDFEAKSFITKEFTEQQNVPYFGAASHVHLGDNGITANSVSGKTFNVEQYIQFEGNYPAFLQWNNLTDAAFFRLPNIANTPLTNRYLPVSFTVNGGVKVYADPEGNLPIIIPEVKEYPPQAYTQTMQWPTGTPPTGALTATWQATKTGKKIEGRISFDYQTAGTNLNAVILPLPTGLPAPLIPAGRTGSLDFLYPASGYLFNSATGGPNGITRIAGMRRNGASFEIYLSQSNSGALKGGDINFVYWIE